jgi:mannose-6-phosphate isomerase-like protein (cupin superfamily)
MQTYRHEDERRILTEYVKDIPFKRAKVIEVKQRCQIGNHYHEKSDSVFYLLKGKAKYQFEPINPNSRREVGWMFEGDCEFVPRNVAHTFDVWAGTILLELASEPYEAKDEIPFIK